MDKELQIAEDIEIARYLTKKANEHDPKLKNKDIADAFQEYDKTMSDDTAKNLVSKLMSEKNKNLRSPTPQQALWLSKILNVSMEEIYLAKDKYIPTHYTIRQLAFEGDYAKIKAMSKDNNGEFDYSIAYDEYDKTIYNYLVEFEKVDIINEMMKETQNKSRFLLYLKDDLLKLAIKYDNAELFNNLYCWIMPIYIKEHMEEDTYAYPYNLVIDERDFIELLSKENIIKSFLDKQEWTDEYWQNRMRFGRFSNSEGKDVTIKLQKEAKVLSPNVKLLLEYSIKEKNKKLFDTIIDSVIDNHTNIIKVINDLDVYKKDLIIDNFGQVCHQNFYSVYPFFVYTISNELKKYIPNDWSKVNELNNSLLELQQFGIKLEER